ncbi:hypothetical protein COO60DRAFT_1009596 [Scenedesmus sp. NREL 46B-D3]|nr:hypothetical protein COO60DRAFT_1009596 [Scenedesmus sp. NREL 46B-D3]
MSKFALPADLSLLVSELEHVLALNGHRAQQHARYITEELQAKADSRDEQDEGKLQLCSTAHTQRAQELLLKHEAFEMCFDAFAQSLYMHLPSHQTNFLQKLWRHAMLLVEGWQELHEHEQQDSKSMTLDYIHLQQEHRVLKSNLKTLKLTVQAMLGDVGALLHAACPLGKEAAALAGSPSSSQSSGNDNSRSSSRNSGSAALGSSQSHQAGGPARRSADIVNSLIHSIERMSQQFAECQAAGKLAAGAAAAADTSSRAHSDLQRQTKGLAGVPQGTGAAPAAVAAGSSQNAFPSQRGPTVGASEQAGARLKAGMPPAVPPQARGTSCKQDKEQGRGKACRNMMSARSADPGSPAMRQNTSLALIGASPSRSHPPGACDRSLAWCKQNAQGTGGNTSSRSSCPAIGHQEDQAAGVPPAAGFPGARSGAAAAAAAAAADSQPGVLSLIDSGRQSAAESCSLARGSINSDAATPPVGSAANHAAGKAAAAAGARSAAGSRGACAPAAAAASGREKAPWVEALMQHPEALQAGCAAVRFNPIAELEVEPSVADWGCGSTAAAPSGSGGSAEAGATAREGLPPGEACSSSGRGSRWHPSTSRSAPRPAAAHAEQQHAGQLLHECAAARAATCDTDDAIYMPEATSGLSGLALATQQHRQQPGSKHSSVRHQQQRPRSNYASLPSAAGLDGVAAHLSHRPISTYAGSRSHSSNSSRSNSSGLAAAASGRSHTFSGASPALTTAAAAAGYVPAGPLTAALHKQAVLSRPEASRQLAGAAHGAQLAAAHGSATAAVAAVCAARLQGPAGASLAQAASSSSRAAAAAGYTTSFGAGKAAAEVEGDAAAARASSGSGGTGGSIRAAWEQQRQQAYSQRLVHRQQQQQQMAPMPEGVMADEPVLGAIGKKASGRTYSMASSSVGSGLVLLGNCNAVSWKQGAASNAAPATGDGISSLPESGTASWQDNCAYVKDAGVAGTAAAAQKTTAATTGAPASSASVNVAAAAAAAPQQAVVAPSAVAGTGEAAAAAAAAADLPREKSEAAYVGLLNAAAAAASAEDSSVGAAFSTKAATAGTEVNEAAAVSAGDLPDTLKPVQLCDSPTKQLRKAAAAAAATAASGAAAVAARSSAAQPSMRATVDKRSLQRCSSSGKIASGAQQQQSMQAAADGSSAASAATGTGGEDCMSPSAPVSKRLRSSAVLVRDIMPQLEQQVGTDGESSADDVAQAQCNKQGKSTAGAAAAEQEGAPQAASHAAVAEAGVQQASVQHGSGLLTSSGKEQLHAELSQDDVGPLRDRDRMHRDTGSATAERMPAGSRDSVHKSGKSSSTAKRSLATGDGAAAAAAAADVGDDAEVPEVTAAAAGIDSGAADELSAADAPLPREQQHGSGCAACSDEATPPAAAQQHLLQPAMRLRTLLIAVREVLG